MDLDLNFLTVGGGVTRGRDLVPDDVGKGAEGGSPVRRLRERHHALARAVAKGMKTDKQIAIEHGYTPQTLVRLRTDSSFQELVDFYARGFEAVQRDALDRLKDLSLEAMDELGDRLETDPDSFSNGQLMELTKLTTDRTGHGPSTKQEVNVNVGFGARLSAAAERVKTIDITPNSGGDE